jgi:hypothetical protein
MRVVVVESLNEEHADPFAFDLGQQQLFAAEDAKALAIE